VIGTRHDPNTGYATAVRTSRRLGSAVLLTHDGYGHVSFQDPSACVERARRAYLVDLVVPPRGTVCEPDRPRPLDPRSGEPFPDRCPAGRPSRPARGGGPSSDHAWQPSVCGRVA
jgi:hypothetical protein